MKSITAYGMAGALALGILLSMGSVTVRADGLPVIYCQLGILTPATLAGNNPATGQPWKPRDPYRLVFISSQRVNPQDSNHPLGDLNEIATWNAIAQQFADNSDQPTLAEATWRVIGSSTTVNARDNTSTNPAVDGTGHPIMLIDGATVVASNFNVLWGGEIEHIINRTENLGQLIGDSSGSTWPLTGTNASGARLTEALRLITSAQRVRQGQANNTVGWIDRDNISGQPGARTNSSHSIYVMSEALTIQTDPTTVIVIR